MKFLYAYMAKPDSTERSETFYLDNCVRPALLARAEMPWGDSVPEREFMHFVLPLRVNNEALDGHRPIIYKELRNRVKGLSMKQAILEINHWCHEKVTYKPSDGRTHSPLQSMSSAEGRCGEESTFTVAALRALGIPARQVYTPRWAHTDDNHAWVEAWAGGQWYFLGACEPEPVLNLGWFNAPAARGMLMHARIFGDYTGSEQRLARNNGTTIINVTANYAPVDTLRVVVVDSLGAEVEGAEVAFRLYNYGEFYPISTQFSNASGRCSLVAGKGDLLVWASKNGKYGLAKASVGMTPCVAVTLDRDDDTPLDTVFDITPPPAIDNTPFVSDEMRAANALRFVREDSVRSAYIATFDTSTPLLAKSRGNHAVISRFLGDYPQSKSLKLLNSLTDKDLTDVTYDVLADHVQADVDTTDFAARHIMSPRVALEELTPYRVRLRQLIPPAMAREMRADPRRWVKWVADSIQTSMSWYPEMLSMSPTSVWKDRVTSPHSRDIFFVAAARVMGIASRIDPVTGKVQWHDGTQWQDAIFASASADSAVSAKAPKGHLSLSYEPSPIVDDPKYFAHFTLSEIVDGQPELLNFPDFAPWSATLREPYELDESTYLITSGQRMADGSVLAKLRTAVVKHGQNTVAALEMRHDDSAPEVIGSFDAETGYVAEGETAPRSILSTTGRGYYVVCLLKAGHEPSDHVVRDIARRSADLDVLGRKILFIYPDETSLAAVDSSLRAGLPQVASFGFDGEKACAESEMVKGADMPVVILADTFNRVIFRSRGYNVGIGERLVDLLRRL